MLPVRRISRRGFMLLDVAVILVILLLVLLIQISINHRSGVLHQETDCRKQMKWIAKAQEQHYSQAATYAGTFRELGPYFQNLESFLCPTSREVYVLYIDDVGRYTLECQFAGHGSIISGDPDWE